jgi:TetR/AcrR family transcriptional regulator, mexJK operon transcriptional repressor
LGEGFSAATMSSIAADAGGSKATLWKYFPSKEVLFEAFVEAATERLPCDVLAQLSAPGEPLAVLQSFVISLTDVLRSNDSLSLQREVGAQAVRLPRVAALLRRRLVDNLEAPLSEFFAAHMASGALRGDDPAEAAWITLALCLGSNHRHLLARDVVHADGDDADGVMSILRRQRQHRCHARVERTEDCRPIVTRFLSELASEYLLYPGPFRPRPTIGECGLRTQPERLDKQCEEAVLECAYANARQKAC